MRTLTIITLVLLANSAAAKGVYFSRNEVLKEFFADSARVGFIKVETSAHAGALRKALGKLPPKDTYVIFVARTGDRIDGYAVIDEQQGQHLPITFATQLTPAGVVQRTEVMVYREGYGDEIRERRFRRQFEGKGSGDPIRYGDDVVAITGATISSESMAVAVKRAVALVRIVVERPQLATKR